MQIKPSTRKLKRFVALFDGGRVTHFGQAGGQTYIDHADKDKRRAYLARHAARENWADPYSAGALSRWLLWGDYPSLDRNIARYIQKFKL